MLIKLNKISVHKPLTRIINVQTHSMNPRKHGLQVLGRIQHLPRAFCEFDTNVTQTLEFAIGGNTKQCVF